VLNVVVSAHEVNSPVILLRISCSNDFENNIARTEQRVSAQFLTV